MSQKSFDPGANLMTTSVADGLTRACREKSKPKFLDNYHGTLYSGQNHQNGSSSGSNKKKK